MCLARTSAFWVLETSDLQSFKIKRWKATFLTMVLGTVVSKEMVALLASETFSLAQHWIVAVIVLISVFTGGGYL